MEKELPKIDLPEEWLVGTGISKELLGLYRNYPVRLKCEIFVLCTSGAVEASVNLNKITVEPNDFIVLTPGSIFQINDIKGDLNIYFGGFSSLSGYDVHHIRTSCDWLKARRCQNDGGVHAAAYQDV